MDQALASSAINRGEETKKNAGGVNQGVLNPLTFGQKLNFKGRREDQGTGRA